MVAQFATTVVSVVTPTLWIVIVLEWLLEFGINHMMGSVRNLSLQTHLLMMKQKLPGLAISFYARILVFANFDMLPAERIYDFFGLEFPGDSPYSNEAEYLGYESNYLMINSGSIPIFMALILLKLIL